MCLIRSSMLFTSRRIWRNAWATFRVGRSLRTVQNIAVAIARTPVSSGGCGTSAGLSERAGVGESPPPGKQSASWRTLPKLRS